MTKAKRSIKASRKATTKPQRKPANAAAPNPDCPYRSGTLYAALFTAGNADYISKDQLIKQVAEKTGKSEKVVSFGYQVLKSKGHKSNGGRSCEIQEGDRVKLIAIRK